MSHILVDLDATLAEYPSNFPEIGPPIPRMVRRVKYWLAEGKEVRIFTARVGNSGRRSKHGVDDDSFAADQRAKIEAWCERHIGRKLVVTATKTFETIEIWDDRSVQVRANTGIRADGIDD
jgi:hypothetical protein